MVINSYQLLVVVMIVISHLLVIYGYQRLSMELPSGKHLYGLPKNGPTGSMVFICHSSINALGLP
jgi:hypothetical protein